jgi:Cu/Ag efflux pump CusA
MAWQDRVIKSMPEVESVAGKLGRAETPTDPAPVEMIETTIILKPQETWRPRSDQRKDHRRAFGKTEFDSRLRARFSPADRKPHPYA